METPYPQDIGKFSERDAAVILQQLMSALAFLHSRYDVGTGICFAWMGKGFEDVSLETVDSRVPEETNVRHTPFLCSAISPL